MTIIAAVLTHFIIFNISLFIGRYLINNDYMGEEWALLSIIMPQFLFTMVLNNYLFDTVFIPLIIL